MADKQAAGKGKVSDSLNKPAAGNYKVSNGFNKFAAGNYKVGNGVNKTVNDNYKIGNGVNKTVNDNYKVTAGSYRIGNVGCKFNPKSIKNLKRSTVFTWHVTCPYHDKKTTKYIIFLLNQLLYLVF